MVRVLFVCLGNICRSPMAEAVFRQLVVQYNLQDKITVDSGGTGDWHIGEPPYEGTRKVLESNRIPWAGKARQVTSSDYDIFDYIIVMDEKNRADLPKYKQEEMSCTIARLMEFVANAAELNIPDPYYTGDFEYTYKLIKEGCSQLLQFIREKHQI